MTTIVKHGLKNTSKHARPIPHQYSEILQTNLAEKVLIKGPSEACGFKWIIIEDGT